MMMKELITSTTMKLANSSILLVDDVPENLKLLGDILHAEGYHIRQAPTGELALRTAEKDPPDLILLDIMMPGMDGFEVCRRLKLNPDLKEIPVIFISAAGDTGSIIRSLTLGGVDYITKPFHEKEVTARVMTHLKLHRYRLELLQLNSALHRQTLELQELNATKDKFFTILAHDLRSPFNGFLGVFNMFINNLPQFTMSQIQSLALEMRDSASGIFTLIENLLEWGQMQQGKSRFNPEMINLMSMLTSNLRPLMEMAEQKGIIIRQEVPADLEVFADSHMLGFILRNLITNAVKFTHNGGSVLVTANRLSGDIVEISIMDNGIGMSRKIVENLFRLDIQTSRKGTNGESSSGLGLILCKEFVERHGGKIGVESEDGQGSRLTFSLPTNALSPTTGPRRELSDETDKSHKRRLKVLIAEDDPLTDLIFTHVLKTVSHYILHANNGEEAVSVARENPDLDMIIMDILMPGIDGIQAIRQIRQFNKNVVIIVQTAQATAVNKMKATEAGCNIFVAKPVIKEDILEMLSRFFGESIL